MISATVALSALTLTVVATYHRGWRAYLGAFAPVYRLIIGGAAVYDAGWAVVSWLEGDRLQAVLHAVAVGLELWIWWRSGGGDGFRRLAKRAGQAVARAGSRLRIVTVSPPAPA